MTIDVVLLVAVLGTLGAIVLQSRIVNSLRDDVDDLRRRMVDVELEISPRTCRVCGCTNAEACWPVGCHWVEEDLCSAHVEAEHV